MHVSHGLNGFASMPNLPKFGIKLNTTHTQCVSVCLIQPNFTSLECSIRKFTELLMVQLFLRMPANIGYIKPEKYKFNQIFNLNSKSIFSESDLVQRDNHETLYL